MSVILQNRNAKRADINTPEIVPIIATAVLPETPPTKYIVTIVVNATTSTAERIGECPL